MGFAQKGNGNPHFSQLAFITMTVLLTTTTCCRGAVPVGNNSTYACHGGLSGCLIAEELAVEMEFLMETNVIRILVGGSGGNHPANNANDPKHPAVKKCPDGRPYTTCLPPGTGQQNSACTGSNPYCRGKRKP